MRARGLRFGLFYGLAVLTSVFTLVALFLAWLFLVIFALDNRAHLSILIIFLPIVVCLLLSMAQRVDLAFTPGQPDPFLQTDSHDETGCCSPTVSSFNQRHARAELDSQIAWFESVEISDPAPAGELLIAALKPEDDPLWDHWLDGGAN
jgi:hypothetical protein